MINIVGLLGFEHHAVTHLTGLTSNLSDAVASGHGSDALRVLSVVGSFLAGSVLSGFLIQDSTLKLGRRYGVALGLESLLLFGSVGLLQAQSHVGVCFAAAACGLQNAMATTYSGATVRTTHLSGMFTDLGIFLGHGCRGLPVDARRIKLCLLIILGFFCGGVAGALVFHVTGYMTLLIPASATGLGAMVYTIRNPR
jgi:uncharacterized membrane protein YoaK (UPF0700 family)